MAESDEHEQWKVMHALQGHLKNVPCAKQCADSLCQSGCLQQSAKVFRGDIMHGIEFARTQDGSKYPLTYTRAFAAGALQCTGQRACDNVLAAHPFPGRACADPVCHVTGCMDVPAWHFRDLIKMASIVALMKALKK